MLSYTPTAVLTDKPTFAYSIAAPLNASARLGTPAARGGAW